MSILAKERNAEKAIFRSLEKHLTMKSNKHDSSTSSAVYAFGFIGAVIYYISVASGFWTGVLGILKALVWPVFLVYEALKAFGA